LPVLDRYHLFSDSCISLVLCLTNEAGSSDHVGSSHLITAPT